jgi:hypothetical protein
MSVSRFFLKERKQVYKNTMQLVCLTRVLSTFELLILSLEPTQTSYILIRCDQ